MDAKEMREVLKIAGVPVPRSNEGVKAAHAEYVFALDMTMKPAVNPQYGPEDIDTAHEENKMRSNPPAVVNPKEIELAGEIYTYVGSGDTPPHMTNFMSMQKFVRGQAVRVTNPIVLGKISHHRDFVKGEVDPESMFAKDEVAAKKVQNQRDEDVKTQIAMDRQNK